MSTSFKRVTEATYLSTEKSNVYRAILRYFYIQHERLKEFLLPEEVHQHLLEARHFAEYSLEELHNDLTALVKWGNLNAQQESGNVKTIEEFKKRRFRYQITPYTVEFERMLIHFEQNSETFSGSLEKTQFERFYEVLEKIRLSTVASPEACHQHWDDLLTYFKKIAQNTSDYFAYLRSENTVEQMKSESFFLYKDKFTLYLRDFIIALQRTAVAIQETMIGLSHNDTDSFFKKVCEHEQRTFRFERMTVETKDYMEELEGTWLNMKSWFLGDASGNSQYENVLYQTNEAIRRITRIVQRLGERSQVQRSRKQDYLHLADWFLRIPSIGESHQLAAAVFGIVHTKHIYTDHIPTDDIYTDVWDEAPTVYERAPSVRDYRVKSKASALDDFSEQKEEARTAYLLQKQKEQGIIDGYRNGSQIILGELPVIEPFVRKLFLSWIGKAMVRHDRVIKTEFGDKIRVDLNKSLKIELVATDGMIQMPAVTFHYLERGEGA